MVQHMESTDDIETLLRKRVMEIYHRGRREGHMEAMWSLRGRLDSGVDLATEVRAYTDAQLKEAGRGN